MLAKNKTTRFDWKLKFRFETILLKTLEKGTQKKQFH